MRPRFCLWLAVAVLPASSATFSGQPTPDPARKERSAPSPTLVGAGDLFAAGAYEHAVEAYKALAPDSRFTLQAGLGLARCRLRLGQYEEAIAGLSALDASDSPSAAYLLAQAYRQVGRYDEVLSHARAAIKLDKDNAGARFLLGDTLELLGRRDEAIETYRWFDRQLVEREELPRDAEWITETAKGFLRYSVLTRTNVARRTKHVLNEMLQMAYERLDRTYWPARIVAADLLRGKYNNDAEDGSLSDYQAALRLNPNLPEAATGIGEVALSRWAFEEVEEQVESALAVNPNYAPAIHLLARNRMFERRYAEAAEVCERALAINPNDLTALSISAASSACRFDDAGVKSNAALVAAVNPRYALFHRTLGDALSGIRQYGASEKAYREAIRLDPTDANARTELGMMYMQWGTEDKARDVLEAAWDLDPFNERTKFTLELLDMLASFDRVETPHFIVKYNADRDPALGEFVAEYMESIYEAVTGDYNTLLEGKTIIELFPTHRAFGVRITGKPWIYTIGACTGRVIALASPRDTAHIERYNMARVLKHEFTHTVTLAATRNRIPHWFTEGLAVLQEDAPRSFEWAKMLANAVRRDRLFTLETINWGFIRPRRADDRQLAYAQSEWMCEYIVERFGYDVIDACLSRFRKGQTLAQVFTGLLKIEPADLDDEFRVWARKQAARWGFDLTPPEDQAELRARASAAGDDAALHGRLARAALDHGDHEAAMTAAGRALELDENELNGLEVMAKILSLLLKGAHGTSAKVAVEDKALPIVVRLLSQSAEGWTAPKLGAEIALRRKETERAKELLERLQRFCPMDPTSWRGLAGIYLERGEEDRALPQLLELARIEETDAEIPAAIARIYKHRDRIPDARYWYRRAIYIDPFSVDLHQALGDTHMQAGDTQQALHEYRIVTEIDPDNPRHHENAAYAAHKLGDKETAQRFARRAIELDPSSAARSLIP